MKKREYVWLGAAAVVIDNEGRWLVVNQQYGGLKGLWTLCAGFVDSGETADQAIVRELSEETGIIGKVKGIIGLRTGVIKHRISDNLIIFLVTPETTELTVDLPNDEIADVRWLHAQELTQLPHSPMIDELLKHEHHLQQLVSTQSPGEQFNYTTYHLFL